MALHAACLQQHVITEPPGLETQCMDCRVATQHWS